MSEEKTLKVLVDELQQKADERGCNLICIVELEGSDGFNVTGCGDRLRLAEMIVQASEENKAFGNILKRATLAISVREVDELLEKRNPLIGKTEN
jgi:hypothetical protein